MQILHLLQQYQQNLAGDLQVWQAERTTDLQKYGTDVQNELNEFNKENTRYQANVQAELAKHNSDLQKALRKAGQPRDYYTAHIQKLSAAKRHLASLRNSLKEDEEVKVAFDQLDALEKKYLGDARNFEDLMIKALANNPKAQITQTLLDSCSEISRLLQRIVTTRDNSLMPALAQRWQTFIQLLRTKGSDQEKIFLAQLEKRLKEIQKGQ